MPEIVHLTVQLEGRDLGKEVALITDGRFSGVSHGILIGHICPEATKGGPLARMRDGDTIIIAHVIRTLDVELSDDELAARDNKKTKPGNVPGPGSVLEKYARLVS